MTRRQIRGLGAAVLVSALMTACSTEDAEGPGPQASTTTRSAPAAAFGEPETVADGLDAPWSIAFHGDTPLVSERDSARILELDAGGNSREVGVVDGVSPRGEGGLLGIAVRENRLYAYFTANGENRIERFDIIGAPGEFALGPAETILDGLASANYHNGGRIAFGPDGMLYVTVGDAGSRDRAQDLDSMSGKILRMTPDGDVPQDNPFPNSFVYSYGHRNSQALPGPRTARCTPASSGRTPGTNSTGSKPVATTGGPRSKGLRVKTDSSTRSNNGHRMMPAPAESPSTTARSTLPTFVVSDSALCRWLTPRPPMSSSSTYTGASVTL